MSDKFGLKIGVEGEREFKNALRDINSSFKALASEMNLVSSQFDKNERSVQSVTARNRVLNKEIDAQRQKISTLEAALKNASDSFGENDKRTQAWAVKLNDAKAELNGMERELSANNKTLDEAGREFDDAGREADEFGREVDKSGKQADDAGGRFEKLGHVVSGVGKAIAAGMAALVAALVVAVKKIYDFAQMASDLGEAQNVVNETFKTSSAEVNSWAATLAGSAGISQTAATKYVGSMGAMLKSSGLSEEAARGMSQQMVQLSGDMASFYNLDNETAWEKIRSGISGETEPLKQLGINMSVANLEAYALAEGINKSYSEMTQAEQTTLRYNYLMKVTADAQGDFARTSEGLANQTRLLSLNMENLKTNIGAEFTETVNSATKAVNGMLSEINALFADGFKDADLGKAADIVVGFVEEMAESLKTMMPKFTGLVVTLLSTLVESVVTLLPVLLPPLLSGVLALFMAIIDTVASNIGPITELALMLVTTLSAGIAEALPTLVPTIVLAVVTIVTTLLENLPMILDSALQIITGLAQGLLAAIPVLIAALPRIILAIVDFIIKSIPLIIDTGIKLLTSLIGALPQIIQAIVAAIPQIINGIITAVIDSIPLIIESGISLLVALIEALPEIITTIVTAIPQIVSGIVDALIGNIGQIIAAGVSLLVALIQNLPSIIVEIASAMPQIINGIVSAIAGLGYMLVNAGSDLIRGLWNGINKMASWLWNKVSGFFSNLWSGIKNFFGANSPSTLFAGLGVDLAQGLGIGFEKQMNRVSKDMQNAIPKRFDLDSEIGAAYNPGTFRGHRTGAQTINQTVNVTTPKPLSERELAREFKNLSRKLALGVN